MGLTAAENYELTLQRLILGFMEFSSDKGEVTFPAFNLNLWNEFLYLAQNDLESEFPALKCIGEFAWEGARPKCQKLNESLFDLAYCFEGTLLENRIVLNKDVKINSENLFYKYYPELAEKMFSLAHKIPGFF